MTNRIKHHPVLGDLENEKYICFHFNDEKIEARGGETVAAALLANNIRILRRHEATSRPRGIYCNIGHCFECRVNINGKRGVRACMTIVEQDMNVCSLEKLPRPFHEGEWQES